ncbi:MAG: effector binding domain-containing protein [Alphaproteobacteria bacterium]|nr:effector binding domain-containing protein [Alphaproteobacteria bacterium]
MSAHAALQYDVKAGLEPVEAFTVRGISAVIDNQDDRAAEQINTLWQSFFEQQVAQRIPERASDVIYAVYSDYEGDHTKPYRLTIGYAAPSDAASAHPMLHAVQVGAGEYASLSARGEQPKALIETWVAVWEGDLDRAFNTDFEVYGPRFFEEGVHEVLVYIGLKEPRA